ncbi:NPC1-like intracellular cholesterol transporter 1 [Anopheles albimanus]|uniref:NPC1-like intracellular cholesterol transporter 1 n=1 Tax=Anopheles albimanus TaxID=7167 RepID=UPI00163FC5E1|nr:NPC1-like intracellular cholesterol transporter 1 [Anopheles albimanus]XP_035775947.1 NPC1-like intracellular cholesterol transporter 1 [Anopheles albimanus]XP_035775948.1 NPC1-like intracellular cholesterol transporter 1 [Anopheles albimanus]
MAQEVTLADEPVAACAADSLEAQPVASKAAVSNGHYIGSNHRTNSEELLHTSANQPVDDEPIPARMNFMGRLSYHVSLLIGTFFYRLGYWISNNAWKTIGLCWLLVALCSIGFVRFHKEKSPMKLWIPHGSKFLHDTNWMIEHFQEGNRIETIMITAPDVLVPEVLQTLATITEEVENFKFRNSKGETNGWTDVCHKVPLIAAYTGDSDGGSAMIASVIDIPSFLFCPILEKLEKGCYGSSLLELWKYDREKINNLTKEEIVDRLNKTTVSPVTGHTVEFSALLGDVQRDWSGRIVSAGSLVTHWYVHVNFTEVDADVSGNAAGTEDWVTENAALWEETFLKIAAKAKREHSTNETDIYYTAGRSYGDISEESMFKDMDKLVYGGIIMFIYMQLVLSKFSWTEFRIILGSVGLMSVGMGFIAGCGLVAASGVSYGPVHTSLPFLLMGLGVDDMFVMMACYRKVRKANPDLLLPERMGLMLQHAGASITVTSLTDIVAFVVGSITVIPSLQSFCIYAAAGVFMMFFFVITFFVAIFTLDEIRIASRRNAFLMWIVHDEKSTGLWCEYNLMHRFINTLYSKVLLTTVGKTLIIFAVILMTSVNIHNLLQLRQKFDPNWFIPEETYYNQFVVKTHEHYPNVGFEALLLFGSLNYTAELPKLLEISQQLENRTDILHSVSSWADAFRGFVSKRYKKDIAVEVLSDSDFRNYLSKFLFSYEGGRFQMNIKFNGKLKCGKPTPNITVTTMDFKFRPFKEREEYIPAKYAVEGILERSNISSGDQFRTLWAKIFGNWVTDEIIDTEIYRNIALALVGVMFCSVVLIVNLQICFWIFVCVLLTLVNVGGLMQVWGLTLDLVSCIALQLAVGLCVDYAAHIGHTFLTINKGDRDSRSLETVLHIGAAVFYGGGSTILSLSILSGSQAYTYRTFFKIFLLVIAFGLFHGTILLPVILSLIGPAPYSGSLHSLNTINNNPSPTKKTCPDGTEMISFIGDQPYKLSEPCP